LSCVIHCVFVFDSTTISYYSFFSDGKNREFASVCASENREWLVTVDGNSVVWESIKGFDFGGIHVTDGSVSTKQQRAVSDKDGLGTFVTLFFPTGVWWFGPD
jgi:hypothetical protein